MVLSKLPGVPPAKSRKVFSHLLSSIEFGVRSDDNCDDDCDGNCDEFAQTQTQTQTQTGAIPMCRLMKALEQDIAESFEMSHGVLWEKPVFNKNRAVAKAEESKRKP